MSNGCVTCHSGVALGGHIFQKFGVYQDYWLETKSENVDEGRATVSKDEADLNVFKVPGLRNISKTYPYFHDGSVRDLKEAIRIMGKIQLNRELTEEQVENIAVFFDALTGEIDPKYTENPHL
ncbi:MAG: c-type cytochrome [Weeksellaceae bacterium]|nr:c-type cytochrome [Weeksellaceae bacterium]